LTSYSRKSSPTEKRAVPTGVVVAVLGVVAVLLAFAAYRTLAPEKPSEKATLMSADSYRKAYSNPTQGAPNTTNPGTPTGR
jgi:hypothetical protein